MIDIDKIFEEIRQRNEKLKLEKLKQPCQILYPHYRIGYWTTFGYIPFTVVDTIFNQNECVYEYQMKNGDYYIWKTEDEITLGGD